jgi:hypothetical protein
MSEEDFYYKSLYHEPLDVAPNSTYYNNSSSYYLCFLSQFLSSFHIELCILSITSFTLITSVYYHYNPQSIVILIISLYFLVIFVYTLVGYCIILSSSSDNNLFSYVFDTLQSFYFTEISKDHSFTNTIESNSTINSSDSEKPKSSTLSELAFTILEAIIEAILS